MAEHQAEWYFSRGDAELYDKCPRARFHRTIGHTGRGIVRRGASFDMTLGRIVHRATEAILVGAASTSEAATLARKAISKWLVEKGEIPQSVGVEFQAQFVQEAEALCEGLVWAWSLGVEPNLRRDYNIIMAEEQTAYRPDGMVLPTVADVVLEDKAGGFLVYPDWKTTKFVNDGWMAQWNRAAQLHTTALAVEQTLGREVEYCYVQALVKGRWQRGYQQSPLVWGYAKGDAGPGDEDFQYNHTARKHYRRVPVWQVCGMERWVKGMPTELLMKLVPRTPPIIVDPELAETWWRQRVIKERKIRRAKHDLALSDEYLAEAHDLGSKTAIMDEAFPQTFTQCDPVASYRCEFYEVCHDPHGVGADPIGSGIFRRRPTYAERLKEEEA